MRNGSDTSQLAYDFDQSIGSISSYDQGSMGGSYTVREGDTLSSIASMLWGDSSLWYKIAEANGLAGEVALFEGQVLVLPTGVIKNTHNASTFSPVRRCKAWIDASPIHASPPANLLKPNASHKIYPTELTPRL